MAIASHWLITLPDEATLTGPGPGPDPGPDPGPIGLSVPNPWETVWRLGIGGVVMNPAVVPGFDLTLVSALLNNGLSVGYTPDPDLEGVIWRGDDQPPLLFPDVVWISGSAGTLQLTIRGSDSSILDPGRYRIRVGLVVGSSRLLAYDGILEVSEIPGPDVDRVPYVTYRDLLFYYDQLPYLQNLKTDETGFLEQRVHASDEFDRTLVTRYNPRPGFIRRRHPSFDPILGYDLPDPSLVPPTKADLTQWLAQQGLVVEREVREIVSRMAISLILARPQTEGPNPYQEDALAMKLMADNLWNSFEAQLDAIPFDGKPDWLICRDATFLPAGAAP